jgi:carbonic anhydrase
MTVTDDLPTKAERYANPFDKGDMPLPPARHVAVVACMDVRLKPTWAAEAFTDLDADVRQNIGRIHAEASIAVMDSVRGFVYDVDTGKLREVDPT